MDLFFNAVGILFNETCATVVHICSIDIYCLFYKAPCMGYGLIS